VLEAGHLGDEVVRELGASLTQLAEEADGQPVLFQWASALQERLVAPRRLLIRPDGPGEPMEAALRLLAHARRVEEERREKEVHVCPFCFDETLGSRGLFLSCGHFGCRECLGTMARLHVSEGNIAALCCPAGDCREPFDPESLRALLGAGSAEMARWEELSLQQALQGMGDVVYCPRCDAEGTGNRVACIEDEDRMARCGACEFVFCGKCRGAWHPGVQCQSADDRMEALEARAAGSGAEAAAARAELLTLRHVARTTKRCPKCEMAIEKTEGCSKMHCRSCDTKFCWRCGKVIEGYDHFATSECRLFDDEEVRRWNQQMRQVDRAQARAHEARFLAQFIDAEQLWKQGRECPRCKAVVVREGKNNHLRCHACMTQFCARCNSVLPKSNPSEHFQKLRICPQHSDD